MTKWWLRRATVTRKYKVKVKAMKLELMDCGEEVIDDDDDDDKNQEFMAIKVKWKGEPKFGLVPFYLARKQPRKDFTKEKMVMKKSGGGGERRWEAIVEWNDDEFENVCSFTNIVSDGDEKFGPWEVCFSVLYGDKRSKKKKKKKVRVIGRVTLNLGEMAGRKKKTKKKKMLMESDHHHEIEAKLPINILSFGGHVSRQANLQVRLEFVEIRDLQVPNTVEPSGLLHEPELRLDKPDRSSQSSSPVKQNEIEANARSSDPQLEYAKKMGLFSWKKRSLSFKLTTSMIEKESGFKNDNNRIDFDQPCSSGSSGSPQVEEDKGAWESEEVTSRDGKTKLKTSMFFASFDQCSNKAAGESACTALVAVIAHWLQVNRDAMPTRPEFDVLILEGSSEWRKLCENDCYTNDFPNKHFDLETVLRADIRPIAISRDDSFVGFFCPEKFESLKGAMSFDEIWDGINRISEDHDDDYEPRTYIVSWNDHFFVLKVEANAYYVIDTLGERLFEGCNQAYILRFDDSSLLYGKSISQEVDNKDEMSGTNDNNPCSEDEMEIVCSGKECCKEFIKRFLAAIPIMELEAEEQKEAVSYYSLHHRLQIELNSINLLSSLKSSPFSSSSNSASSNCWTDECI